MSDLWIEDDLEKTPVARITVLEEPFEMLLTQRLNPQRKSRAR